MIAARTEQSCIKSNFRVKSISVLPWESEKGLKLVQVALTVKGLKDEMSMAGNGKGEELVNTGSEGNLAVAAVTPLTAKVNSFDNQVRLQGIPTKIHQSREMEN